jgi:hypothetical protein
MATAFDDADESSVSLDSGETTPRAGMGPVRYACVLASPSELSASPSELLASPSELSASPSEL